MANPVMNSSVINYKYFITDSTATKVEWIQGFVLDMIFVFHYNETDEVQKKKEMDQLNAEKSNFFALFGLP